MRKRSTARERVEVCERERERKRSTQREAQRERSRERDRGREREGTTIEKETVGQRERR